MRAIASALALECGRDVLMDPQNGAADRLELDAISAVKRGDHAQFDFLVQKYLRRTISIVYGIVRNPTDAEELTQEAFVRAFEKIGRFREGEPFAPWLYRIATNLALDLVKHRSRVRHEPAAESLETAATSRADAMAESNEVASRIDRALEELPQMQRREIAVITGLSEGTVRSHLSHARKKLQDALGDLRPRGEGR